MFIFNFFSNTFLIFNFLRFWLCILLQRLFYYGSEAIEWFILLKYCVNTFDFSLATYLDLVLTKKNRTKLSFIQCTVAQGRDATVWPTAWDRRQVQSYYGYPVSVLEATWNRWFLDLDFPTLFEGIHCKKFLIKTFQNPSVFPRTSLAIESVEWSKRRLRAGRRARKGCFVICHLLLGLLLVVSLASGLLELSWLIACHTALVESVVGVRG